MRMIPFKMNEMLTSCQADVPNMATKFKIRLNVVITTRKSQAEGSTRQSIWTNQIYTHTSNPHIRA